MQIKLSQHEIQSALFQFLQARSTAPICITGFDLKGTRSEEGMHFLVDMQYQDIDYTEEYPLIEPSVPTREPRSVPTLNVDVPKVTPMAQEDTDEIVRINELLQNNVCGIHNQTIYDAVENGSEAVRNHYKAKPFYVEIQTLIEQSKEEEKIEEVTTEEKSTEGTPPWTAQAETSQESEPVVESVPETTEDKQQTQAVNIFGQPIVIA